MADLVKIAPSVLSADFTRLGEQAQAAEQAGADYLHIDVMDGQFVPTITFGSIVVAALRPLVKIPLDVHMMVQRPDSLFAEFAEAGADSISVHVEATMHLHRSLDALHKLGVRAGAAINPGTPLSSVEDVLSDLDLINLMSVNPGYSGQSFIPTMLPKIARLRRMLDEGGYDILLEVDGGVSPSTAPDVVKAGARMLVAGSAVFNVRGSVADNMQALRDVLKGTA